MIVSSLQLRLIVFVLAIERVLRRVLLMVLVLEVVV